MRFKHLNKYNISELESETQADGSRFYVSPEGKKYPSVTTVTGWRKKEMFKEWREKNPDKSKRILEKGTNFHDIVERYLDNQEISLDNSGDIEAYSLFDNARNYLNKIQNVRVQEVSLHSDLLEMAGRVDCIAEYDGVPCIIDFKTSKRMKERNEIDNYFCQATAYSIMWKEITGENIPYLLILISTDYGEVQEYRGNAMDYVKPLKEMIDEYKANH
jgi:ATP-dependent exoDNAse (exonuclease V) beta subunit